MRTPFANPRAREDQFVGTTFVGMPFRNPSCQHQDRRQHQAYWGHLLYGVLMLMCFLLGWRVNTLSPSIYNLIASGLPLVLLLALRLNGWMLFIALVIQYGVSW